MYFKNQTFCVFGISSSGKCAAEKLLSLGATTFVFDEDDDPRVRKICEGLFALGAKSAFDNVGDVLKKSDVIVVSPGVRIDHPLLISAKREKKRIIGELELGYRFTRAAITAVTGTNGKTTTCSLISACLEKAGIKNGVLGNYGVPLTINGEAYSESDVAVVEVSSFQLETVQAFCPHVAVVLNVTSDHLDRHYTRENYVYLKSKILCNLRESEYAVLNYDDPTVRSFGAGIKAKVVWFSRKEKVGGAYVSDGFFYYFDEKLFPVSALKLTGEHNEENALAAISAAKINGVAVDCIADAFSNFRGVRHRIELIAQKGGVDYYNDSKATNVDSTIKAIETMTKPTVLILGGKAKKQDYAPLFGKLDSSLVRHAVLTGENRFELLEAAGRAGFNKVTVSPNFESAVKIAKIEAKNSYAVLLSPATSSFDAFLNYEERGVEFERIVKEIS